jgi:hypothetical protein
MRNGRASERRREKRWRCECPSCGCTETATTTDDADVPVCDDCQGYYVDADGEVVCPQTQTSDDSCRHCGEAIEWGAIQTGAPGVANYVDGDCGCGEDYWRQTERGGDWVISEHPAD